MLTRVNRVVMAVPDRQQAARPWLKILGAEHDGDDRLDVWSAHRSRLRVGTGWVDLLEPDGAGVVADAVARRGPHLFAGGVTTPDLDLLTERLRGAAVTWEAKNGEVYVSPGGSAERLRIVVGADEVKTQIGRLQHFYEITALVADADERLTQFADLFGLRTATFVPIASDRYGYAGTLAMFRDGHLDRIEIVSPTGGDTTMGRFHARHGESLYMAFAECDAISVVQTKAEEHGLGCTVEDDRHGAHTIFLHPDSMGGLLLGVSRSTYAWRWSGSPERVRD